MPRYYRRYYRRTGYSSYKKRKWSPTLIQTTSTLSSTAGNETVFTDAILCQNSANSGSTTPVSTIIKVKNFKCVLDIVTVASQAGVSVGRNFFVAIMFIPQGFTLDANTPVQHPEWIMAWRTIDCSTVSANALQNVQISSRLSRNLNSGDSIVLYSSFYALIAATVSLTSVTSFVTCCN